MRRILNDLEGMETLTFLEKVSDLSKQSEEAGKIHIKKRFEESYLLSDKKACHSVAILMKWNNLAAYFAEILKELIENKEVSHG